MNQIPRYRCLPKELYDYPEKRHMLVSRIVCLAFHGEPDNDSMHASHIDGNRKNNRADNLCWESASWNNHRRVAGHPPNWTPPEVCDDDDIPF